MSKHDEAHERLSEAVSRYRAVKAPAEKHTLSDAKASAWARFDKEAALTDVQAAADDYVGSFDDVTPEAVEAWYAELDDELAAE
jgi:hypothetical protein